MTTAVARHTPLSAPAPAVLPTPCVAATPPMGWNSWDCYGVSVTEADVRANAEFMAAHLRPLGWEYVVVDLGWYAPHATTANYKQWGLDQLVDNYGRLVPAPNKFPSAVGGAGFRPLADYVHSLGLKFGLHIMRGMPWQAAAEDLPIKDSSASAAQVAQPLDRCRWFANNYGVNLTVAGGQEYYNSLVDLYADWGVDFIKADDMNAWDGEGHQEPYHVDEVEALHRAIDRCGRPIVLSLSPGAARLAHARHLSRHANMWRISCDLWDDWAAVKRQFARCRLWAPFASTSHWPDADMLPLGRLGIRGEVGEPRDTHLTPAEQQSLMTLWCMCRSPLFFGGDLPSSDPRTIELLTNPQVLAVNQASCGNREIAGSDDQDAVWYAHSPAGDYHYVALFNLTDHPRTVSVDWPQCGLRGSFAVHDLWQNTNLGRIPQQLTVELGPHAAGLYRLSE